MGLSVLRYLSLADKPKVVGSVLTQNKYLFTLCSLFCESTLRTSARWIRGVTICFSPIANTRNYLIFHRYSIAYQRYQVKHKYVCKIRTRSVNKRATFASDCQLPLFQVLELKSEANQFYFREPPSSFSFKFP